MRRGAAQHAQGQPRAPSASAPPEMQRLRGGGVFSRWDCDDDTGADLDLGVFRRRIGFLGLLCVAFTGAVFMTTLLRPVLEPFLWALFLVIAMQPISTCIEEVLIFFGRCLCGCLGLAGSPQRRWPRSPPPRAARPCPLSREDPEIELQNLGDAGGCAVPSAAAIAAATEVAGRDDGRGGGRADAGYSPASSEGELWELPRIGGLCGSCCECLSRIIAVTGALAVVMGVAFAVAMFVFEGAIRVQENFAIYELGAKNAVENVKEFFSILFGHMPRTVVDQISDNALASAKTIVSELIGEFLSHAGKILVELALLGLYVMFWLCTPMPLNTKTERIFRRYLVLKGSACLCYGICVGVMLSFLQIELAAVFGLMSFFFSFIPEVGAFFAMVFPVPVILFDSRLEAPWLTLTMATAGQLCLKFVFSNIIEVKLVENDATMKMHPVITLLAVTFFGFIWGPTGMLLSVPIMAYLKVVLLSDQVPSAYRDPVLVLLEGDRRAPERHRKRRALSAAAEELAAAAAELRRDEEWRRRS